MDPELERTLGLLIISCRIPAQPDQHGAEDIASPELRDFGQSMSSASAEDRVAALRLVAEEIFSAAPFGAARLAIFCGASVERGVDPMVTGPAVIDQLRRNLEAAVELIATIADDGHRPENLAEIAATEEQESIAALQFLAQSTVSHLARSKELCDRLRADGDFLARLEETRGYVIGAEWVHGILSIRSGEFLALIQSNRVGFRIVYENVGNNFHLFSLLHAELAPLLNLDVAGRERAFAAARGKEPADPKLNDTALWNFCDYRAAAPDGNSAFAWVWGEASPDTIPELDGVKVLLLQPVTTSRSWNGGFYAPQLQQSPPSVKITEHLTPESFTQWMHRAAEASAPHSVNETRPTPKKPPAAAWKPWWRIW